MQEHKHTVSLFIIQFFMNLKLIHEYSGTSKHDDFGAEG